MVKNWAELHDLRFMTHKKRTGLMFMTHGEELG